MSDRDPMALYAAIRISELCPDRHTPICEIGGGAGYMAFYLSQLGYTDITIIDFPTINTAQGYWLRANPSYALRNRFLDFWAVRRS